jgi:hypothetical protein
LKNLDPICQLNKSMQLAHAPPWPAFGSTLK